jgi:protocatechuate 3,4-dioxygenase beta subunit
MGANICLDHKGEDMVISGRILYTEGRPIASAVIDVWQANDEGFYDVQQKGIQPDFNLRGVFRTGADGRYWFRAVKPKFYPIPDDGPVGKLLRAPPLHHQGRRVREPDHPHLRSPRPLHQLRRRLRREGKPARRVPQGRRSGAGEGARLRGLVLGCRARLRAGSRSPKVTALAIRPHRLSSDG